MNRPKYIIIHCSDSTFGDAKTIDKWHKEFGWNMIGYHYLIRNSYAIKNVSTPEFDGTIEVGRAERMAGSHAKGYNTMSIGICLIGKAREDGEPYYTDNQLNSLISLVYDIKDRYRILTKNIRGHYEMTQSDKTCPDFDVSQFRDLITIYND